MNNILDGQITPKEFSNFMESKVPLFYKYCLERKYTFLATVETLHDEAFCNEQYVLLDNSELTDPELLKYLHSLKIAVSRITERVEILYGGL